MGYNGLRLLDKDQTNIKEHVEDVNTLNGGGKALVNCQHAKDDLQSGPVRSRSRVIEESIRVQ